MKKIISLILIMALCVTTVFANGSSEASEEVPTIRVVWTDNLLPPSGRMLKYVEDKVGVKVEFIECSMQDYLQKTNVMLASGDVPDILQLRENTEAFYKEWIDNDYLLVLDDIMQDYPVLKDRIENTKDMSYRDGHYYAIPKKFATHPLTMYYRQDLLDKYGLEIPETMDDFYNVISTISKGEGCYGFTSNGLQFTEFIIGSYTGAAAWNKIRTWVPNGNEFDDVVVVPEMREALRFLHKLYVEGLYDPEFAIKVPISTMHERFISGNVCTLSGHIESGMFYDKLVSQTESNIPGAKVVAAPHPVGKIGHPFVYTRDNYTCYMYISKDTKHADKCMELLEFLFSPEGYKFNQYGIEGIHYTEDANGNITKNWDEILKDCATASDPLSKWRWLSDIQAGIYPENAIDRDKQKELFDFNQEWPSIPRLSGFTSENDIMYGPTLQQMAEEWLVGFINGKKNLDTQWDEWVDAYYKAGYDKVRKDANDFAKTHPGV